MGKFVFYVSCFDDCHNSVMGVVVVVVSKNYLLNDHTLEQIFLISTTTPTSYYKGIGGIKGWDLTSHIVYLSSLLYSCAAEYFSC